MTATQGSLYSTAWGGMLGVSVSQLCAVLENDIKLMLMNI